MDFNTWKQFYEWGFCTVEQLKEATEQGMLTQEQYNQIVNPPVQPQSIIGTTSAETQPVAQPTIETPSKDK